MARKIEQQVTDAVRARRAFCGGNTTVAPHQMDLLVSLHGNAIAHLSGGVLHLNWCGWHTPTTSSRLNCVLDALAPEYYACIKNGIGRIMRRTDHTEVGTVLQVSP